MTYRGPLDILVLHFDRVDLLARTIDSLLAAIDREGTAYRTTVWIRDNGSAPHHRDAARKIVSDAHARCRERIAWSESPENAGFARGMNALWKLARPRGWVLCLNSDTEVDADFLVQLRTHLPEPTQKRFLAPIIEERGRRYWGGEMQLWRGTARMSPAARPKRAFATGSALFLPAPVLPEAGPWNEAFFFYGEDVELSHRLVRSGWSLDLIPVTVRHAGRASLDFERALELHFRGRATVVRHAGLPSIAQRAIRCIIVLELLAKTFAWALTARRNLASASWRGWMHGSRRVAGPLPAGRGR